MISKYPSEKQVLRNDLTGVTIWQMTNYPAIHYNLGYTGQSSFTPDNKNLIFFSNRFNKNYDLFIMDIDSGDIKRLTDNREGGVLWAGQGLAPDGKRIYYKKNSSDGKSSLFVLELENGRETCLIEFINYRIGFFGGITGNNKKLIFNLVQSDTGHRSLAVAELQNPEQIKELKFLYTSPAPERIGAILLPENEIAPICYAIYESELWAIDWNGRNRRHITGKLGKTWITHPIRFSDDELFFIDWKTRTISIINIYNSCTRKLVKSNAFHINSSQNKRSLVCDTAFPDTGIQLIDINSGHTEPLCYSKASNGGIGWTMDITVPKLFEIEKFYGEQILGHQSTHAHPVFSPDGTKVCYQSNVCGYTQLYIALIK